MITPTDENLMTDVQEGQLSKMAVLFERHHKALFRYFVRLTGRRELSEDLVQDVFFRLMKFRQTYQQGNPFKAWVYQIARNAYIDSARKHKWEALMPGEDDSAEDSLPSLFALPDEQFRQRQEANYLRQALASLPTEKREVLLMARFQELKYDEIARILDCEVNTVKVRVHRALKDLGARFRELVETPKESETKRNQ